MGKSSVNGPFSIAMLNNQRVYQIITCWRQPTDESWWINPSLVVNPGWRYRADDLRVTGNRGHGAFQNHAEVFEPAPVPKSAQAFTEWKRKTSQIQKARGISGMVHRALQWCMGFLGSKMQKEWLVRNQLVISKGNIKIYQKIGKECKGNIIVV